MSFVTVTRNKFVKKDGSIRLPQYDSLGRRIRDKTYYDEIELYMMATDEELDLFKSGFVMYAKEDAHVHTQITIIQKF